MEVASIGSNFDVKSPTMHTQRNIDFIELLMKLCTAEKANVIVNCYQIQHPLGKCSNFTFV